MNRHRPPLLNALCFLSIVGSSIGFLGYFLASLKFEKVCDSIITYSSLNSTEGLSPLYFTLLMALNGISLASVIRVWKLHKDGFYLYSVVQVLILFLPVVWLGWNSFSVINTIFTFIFIGGFLLFFKKLR